MSMDIDQFTNSLLRHAGLIHKVAFAFCRNATDRDDVIQKIAMQLWRSRDRVDDRFRETTWIYRIANNVAEPHFRILFATKNFSMTTDNAANLKSEKGPSLQVGF